jgi:hypothetical protein
VSDLVLAAAVAAAAVVVVVVVAVVESAIPSRVKRFLTSPNSLQPKGLFPPSIKTAKA